MAGTIDFNLLALFVAVAETSSFSKAARQLGLPKSTLSRGIARLEELVGAELLHRTTRHVSLSTAGAALYERTAPLLVELRRAVGTLPESEEQPSGELRITAPIDVGVMILSDVIARFTLRFPSVRVDVRLTNRQVDLVAEGFDLAIRGSVEQLRDSSLVVRHLSPVEIQLFAAPTYLARRGTPHTLGDPDHDWVLFRHPSLQRLAGARDVKPRVSCDDFAFAREALRAGAGVGWLPTFVAEPLVAAGELARVLPSQRHRFGALALLHPPGKHLPRKVTAFRDLLLETVKARPLAH
jgi:DNA-binding transcriptional LysR family regulator